MKNQTQIIAPAIVLIALLAPVAFAEVPATTGTISKVTVYRGQALVTRTVRVDLPPGTSELIVKDLPAKIVPESIYAQTSDNTKYYKQRIELEDKITGLKKEQQLLDRKRNELVAGQSRTEREAVLFISRAGDKRIAIELSYLVGGANRQQQYNLRADPEKSNVLIEYNAIVNQTSGEDWDGVALR